MKNLAVIKVLLGLFVFSFLNFPHLQAQVKLESRNVATGQDTPWDLVWGPDDWIWFTERKGNVKKVNPETGNVQKISDLSEVNERGEGGLMGMTIHPNFNDTPQVFLAYNYLNGGGNYEVKVVRFRYSQGGLTNKKTIIDDIEGDNIHDGCRLIISPDRKLFITTGDAGNKNQYPQDNKSVNGKVLRLNLDGSIPSDNPINGNPMWSKGHRNAQGLVMANGILYSSEHGPQSNDEFHIIKKGRNYGWPEVKGYCNNSWEKDFCRDSNVVEPLKAWTPTLAVCGIDYYGHPRISEWKNSILMTNLKASKLVQLQLNEDGTELDTSHIYLDDRFGRLRDVLVGPEGKVYIATSNRDGRGNPAGKDDRIIELDTGDSGIPQGNAPWFKVQPNPLNRSTEIRFIQQFSKVRIRLYDKKGKEIRSNQLKEVKKHSLNLENLSEGVYFLEVKDTHSDRQSIQKLLIQ